MSQLILPVPETVTSHYVVATDEPPDDPYRVVPWRVGEPFRATAVEALRTDRLRIFTIPATEAVWHLGGLRACDEDHRSLRASSHHIVVVHETAVAGQPHSEQVARAVARALADASHGVLVDPQARHVVLRDGLARAERRTFRMGDQWFGVRYEPHRTDDPSERSDDAAPAANHGRLRITLFGLRRFGLPDLVVDQVARADDLPALNLLRALAYRMFVGQGEWVMRRHGGTSWCIEDHLTVEPGDFWSYWAAAPFVDTAPVTVRLGTPEEREPVRLDVGPAADYDGPRAEWCRAVLGAALPSIVGCPADEDTPMRSPVGGVV